MAEIVVCDISKKFGQQVVLDHISMKLSSPHIYGLVGRNGSGKTMLMRHLCGFVQRIVYHLAAQVHFPKETTGICMT